MAHATLITFMISLAVGLAGISLLHELYRRHGRDYLRAGVRQLVLFNAVLLIQLLYSYYTLNLVPEWRAPVPITTIYLGLSLPLKVIWIFSLGIMVVNLLGVAVPPRIRNMLRIATCGLILAVSLLVIAALVRSDPGPLFQVQAVVELVVIAGLATICGYLFSRLGWLKVPSERRLARDFGITLLGIWTPVIISILLGARLWPDLHQLRLFIHALLILGFNLVPFLLLRQRLPHLPPFRSDRKPDWQRLQSDFGITPREREIIQLICQGRRNQEIADELFISLQTVKDHNYRIFRKLGVKTRVQAANLVRGGGEGDG